MFLITGGCGFLGSNIAHKLIKEGEEFIIFDNLSRIGTKKNLEWLKSLGNFEFINGDIRDQDQVNHLFDKYKPDVVYHLAGQVAMTTSIENPMNDFQINAMGTLNLLEAIRNSKISPLVIYSSTNKVYGDLEYLNYEEKKYRYVAPDYPDGFRAEDLRLDFHSPYGCSKGCADQYMLDYSRIFGLNTVVLRHSSMYGGRQYSTYDQGWIGWFCQKAVEKSMNKDTGFTISGNGKQVRDVLYSDDVAGLYYSIACNYEKLSKKVYNVGGGMKNSLSLLELFNLLESGLDIELSFEKLPWRESDQKIFVADISDLKSDLGWIPEIDFKTGIDKMLEWEISILG